MTLSAGSHIGPYQILAPIGSGGMGEVYRAHDARLGRDVALKILSTELAASVDHLRRFEQEARAASGLNHPNIVTVYDVGRVDSIAYIAMEMVDGRDLRSMLAGERMMLKLVLRIAVKIADGLSAAHERGIVHRDLKPENVMVSRDGFVKILDFGLAKLVRPFMETDSTIPQTVPGAVFGTVGYMSPEQASGKETDHRADQFALGVILYEMLTGRMPFVAPTAAETLAAIIRTDPPPVAAVNANVPVELVRIIDRCLAKEREDRYASTRDLARDLREIRDRSSIPSHPGHRSGPVYLRSPRMLAGITAAAAIVIVALVYVLMQNWPPVKVAEKSTKAATVSGPQFRNPADRETYLQVRNLLENTREEKSIDQAIVMLERLQGNERDSAAVNALLGRALYFKSELSRTPALKEKAIVYAERAVKLDEAEPEAHVTLGQLRNAYGRYDEAISEFTRTLALSPNHPRAVSGLGDAHAALGHNDEAEKMYKQFIALRPNQPGAHIKYGLFCLSRNRPNEAITHLSRAAQLEPQSPTAFVNLGAAYQTVGRHNDALTAYQRSLAIEPSAAAYSNVGTVQFALGQFAEAARSFEQAARLSPDDYLIWSNLGDAYRWVPGQRAESIETYAIAIDRARTAISVNPRDPLVHAVVAMCQAKSGEMAEANRSIRAALDIDPTSANVLYCAAVVAHLRGNSDSAMTWLRSAVSAGYGAADAEHDPEFRSIRESQAFRSAIEPEKKRG